MFKKGPPDAVKIILSIFSLFSFLISFQIEKCSESIGIKFVLYFVNFFKKHQLSIEKISYGSLDKIFSNIQNKNIFLKIDIEGYEYRILDEIMSNQNRIIGMVIEFHNIDLHMDRIYNFINNFNLELIHIHLSLIHI